MKRLFSTFVLAVGFFAIANAQTSLVGRVYYHSNALADEMKSMQKDVDSKVKESIREEVAKAEKKKGRPLTAEEKEKVRKEVEEARKVTEALLKGVKTAITVTFKTDKEMEMKMKLEVDDETLKNGGIGWAKRKAMKATIALLPSSQKMKYTVKDTLIICNDGSDKDTLTISEDGKYLYGKMDEKTKFKLTRKQ